MSLTSWDLHASFFTFHPSFPTDPKLLKGAVEIFASLYSQKPSSGNKESASPTQDTTTKSTSGKSHGGLPASSSSTTMSDSNSRTENLTSLPSDGDEKSGTAPGTNPASNSDNKDSDNLVSSSVLSANSHNAPAWSCERNVAIDDDSEDREEECKELSENLSSFFIFLLREAGVSCASFIYFCNQINTNKRFSNIC